jgi:hypothetical protein
MSVFSIPSNARQEIKFVCYLHDLDKISTWLKSLEITTRKSYSDRYVNNIYLDTYDYSAYASNLSGESRRIKVRYRWYGQDNLIDKGRLEVKTKRNYYGWKYGYDVDSNPYVSGLTLKKFLNNIRDSIDLNGRQWIDDNPLPVILNRYKRSYYETSDEKIRITIDRSQQVFDQRFLIYPNFTKKALLPDTVVIEVKFDRKDRALASRIVRGIPVRVSRHSKYMNAVNTVAWNTWV